MPYAYVNKITFLSYPFKFTPRYLRATDRRIENRRRRRHNFFRNLFLEVWRRMRNVRLAGMTTVTKWNYADIENHDGRLRLHLTVSRKPWGFLSLKGVKIPKLNWRNNEPRCRAFDSGAKTFKRNYVLLFNLHHLLFSFLSDLNGFELATKSRENDEWDDFVPPKAVLWRSEVATMLAQKLVLPVKSSVNCDAARRKRSIGPAKIWRGFKNDRGTDSDGTKRKRCQADRSRIFSNIFFIRINVRLRLMNRRREKMRESSARKCGNCPAERMTSENNVRRWYFDAK